MPALISRLFFLLLGEFPKVRGSFKGSLKGSFKGSIGVPYRVEGLELGAPLKGSIRVPLRDL